MEGRKVLRFVGAGVLLCAVAVAAGPAQAALFTIGNPGNTWTSFVGQNFSPSVEPNPDPGLQASDTVYLTRFTFYSSGQGIGAAGTHLVILDGAYPQITGLTVSSPVVLGVSVNNFDTAAMSTGQAMAFDFSNVALTYGNYYTAAFATIGQGGQLNFLLVGALGADWVEVAPGQWRPSPNYGGESGSYWNTAALWWDGSSGWFSGFSYGGDANFVAEFVPEPLTLTLLLPALVLIGRRSH